MFGGGQLKSNDARSTSFLFDAPFKQPTEEETASKKYQMKFQAHHMIVAAGGVDRNRIRLAAGGSHVTEIADISES
jgi:hypothetical protein